METRGAHDQTVLCEELGMRLQLWLWWHKKDSQNHDNFLNPNQVACANTSARCYHDITVKIEQNERSTKMYQCSRYFILSIELLWETKTCPRNNKCCAWFSNFCFWWPLLVIPKKTHYYASVFTSLAWTESMLLNMYQFNVVDNLIMSSMLLRNKWFCFLRISFQMEVKMPVLSITDCL